MTLGFLFWLLFVLALLFGIYPLWPNATANGRINAGGSLLVLILLFILGWKVFGFVIQG